MHATFITSAFLLGLAFAEPISKLHLKGPNADGVYPYRYFPKGDAPDGLNYVEFDKVDTVHGNSTSSTGEADVAVTKRAASSINEAQVARDLLKRSSISIVVCNGGFSEANNRCSGKCTGFTVQLEQCQNTPGTQCIENFTGEGGDTQVCNRLCGVSGGQCNPMNALKIQQFPDCAGAVNCANVPGTQRVTYL